jgi:YD repeat-containing protein
VALVIHRLYSTAFVVRRACTLALFVCGFAVAARTAAQDAVFDAKGFQQNRDYFSQQPYENIDTLSGNLILTFTDLALPGNAGHDLKFQRTYNSKLGGASWSFGLAGYVMQVNETDLSGPPLGSVCPECYLPQLVLADGGQPQTIWVTNPFAQGGNRYVITGQFLKYDRQQRQLLLPDGEICSYDTAGRLTQIRDTFGNITSLAWGPGALQVIQHLGTESREVDISLTADSFTNVAYASWASMTFAGRTWAYHWGGPVASPTLTSVTPPVGPAWQYAYDPSDATALVLLTTPAGGQEAFAYNTHQFGRLQDVANQTYVNSRVLTTRAVAGRGVTPGTWTYNYIPATPQDPCPCERTAILAPDGTTVTFRYEIVGLPYDPSLGGDYSVTRRTVTGPQGQILEDEARHYTSLPVVANIVGGTPEVDQQTVTRDGRTYSSTFRYSNQNFGDYHRPYQVTESGELSRTTSRQFDYGFTFYNTGKPSSEMVTVNGESFTKSWTYDHGTGFLSQESDYGIVTSFGADASGNVARVTKGNGHTTYSTYDWGIVNQITTPKYIVSRSINPEGTVASETRGGRTTTFFYDDLFRIAQTQPPGGTNPITSDYDNVYGAQVTVHRGQSSITTTVDGFGKPIGTQNSVGIQTTTRYDAMGRTVYEGYPFTSADIGTSIQYDGLGRAIRRTNPDGSSVRTAYGPGTLTVTDENGHVSTQTRQSFGNPDEARLAALVDADGKNWQYSYNALGKLTKVVAPDALERRWTYDSRNLPTSETHPESGTVAYDQYDGAGNLTQKHDANGTKFTYYYDDNDRIILVDAGGRETITDYEAGTDNRSIVSNDDVTTTFAYDGAGRPMTRNDSIDGLPTEETFDYDANDNLALITYASSRQIGYSYDSESRITLVRDVHSGRNLATSFAYHPSGALIEFTSGNGVVNRTDFDPNRYWPTSIRAGDLNLAYADYDGVGNVGAILDSRPNYNQALAYDVLDRLTQASSASYGALMYAYDAHGNRTSTASTSYDYWPGTLRLRSQDIRQFNYDNNGNLLSRTGPNATFTYSPENRIESGTTATAAFAYLYDGDGWRVRKTVEDVTSYYVRGVRGELLTEFDKVDMPSHLARDYVYAGSRLLASVLSTAGSATTNCIGAVSPNAITFPATGGRMTVVVSGCPGGWTVTKPSSATWLSVATRGFGDTPLDLVALAIPDGQSRKVSVLIAGQLLTVNQSSAAGPGELLAAGILRPGQALSSANGLYSLAYATTGDLILSMPHFCATVLWTSGTAGATLGQLAMQGDGNLVLSDAGGVPRWSSGTVGNFGAHAVLENDGNFVIYPPAGDALWSTRTNLFPAAHGDTVHNGERLESITSADGRFRFEDKCDGDLALTRIRDGVQLWPSTSPVEVHGPVDLEGGRLLGYDSFRPPRSVVLSLGGNTPGDHLTVQSDGNVVLSDVSGTPVWWTGTLDLPFASGDTLMPGYQVSTLTSQNGAFQLTHRSDGRLLYTRLADGRLLWPVDDDIAGLGPATMNPDGTFALYYAALPDNRIRWSVPTIGQRAGSHLMLQNDGNIVIYDAGGVPSWDLGYAEYASASGSTLYAGQQLATLTSSNGRYQLTHPAGGAPVQLIRTTDQQVLWPHGEDVQWIGLGPAALLGSGDFVIYDRLEPPRQVMSSLGVSGHPNAHLTVEDDGSVDLYDANGVRYQQWLPAWELPTASGDTLHVGQSLASLTSNNGLITLQHQSDGNVVLLGGGHVLWNSVTVGSGLGNATVQSDGTFVIFDAEGDTVRVYPSYFDVYTGRPNAHLVVQNDGNLVLYDGTTVLWATFTSYAPPPPPPVQLPVATADTLRMGEQMDELWSTNGRFLFAHQGDGNIVLYDTCFSPGDVLWNSGTEWAGNGTTASLTNGGLSLSRDGRLLWLMGTVDDATDHPGAYLDVQNDGNVVIYDGGEVLWATLWEPSFHWPEPCGGSTPPDPGNPDADVRLNPGDSLGTLTSPNGQYQLVFDPQQGNVILSSGGQRLWDMGASGGARAVMQTDGNFVIYADGGSSHPLRWVNNGGHQSEGWYMRLTNDGRVELRNAAGQVMWDRNSSVHP